MAILPVFKLMVLLSRTLSVPVSNYLKKRGTKSKLFRNVVLNPPAQIYHWVDVRVKMKMLNLGKPSEVPKLNETMAMELGADILGETVVFGVASACLIVEYFRMVYKERQKEAEKDRRTSELESRIYELEFIVTEQEARLSQLARKHNTGFRAAWKSPLSKQQPNQALADKSKKDEKSSPPSRPRRSSDEGDDGGDADGDGDAAKPDGVLGQTISDIMSTFRR